MEGDAIMRLLLKLLVMMAVAVAIGEATATWRHCDAIQAQLRLPSNLLDPDGPTFNQQLNRLRRLRGIDPILDELTDDPDREIVVASFQVSRCKPEE
jgi:hypothetical protein